MNVSFGPRLMMALALLCAIAGCGNPGRTNKQEEESSLKPLAKFYGDFVNQHRGKPPADEDEFKTFLKEASNTNLLKAEFQITDIDKLFISPRDNQPYVIYYKTISQSQGPGGAPVVAYEKTGVNGKRFVASVLGGVVQLDDSAFSSMVKDPR